MPVLKNTNPLGDVDLPLIGRQGDLCLKAGEEFEVNDLDAANLLAQLGNYEAVDKAAKKIAADLAKPAVVGEAGPELINPPEGTPVAPATPEDG